MEADSDCVISIRTSCVLIFKMEKGTYIIVTEARRAFTCQVGKLGKLAGRKGYYFYVGSALGSGGIKSRVNHHLQISTNPRWHFDYLRPFVTPLRIWYCSSLNRYEHQWAAVLAALPNAVIPLTKFGATDCQCDAHLYYFKRAPDIQIFRKALQNLSIHANYLRELPVEQWDDSKDLEEG